MMTPQLLTALGTQIYSGQNLSLSQIYDSLIKAWISSLSRAIPGRVRHTIEKRLREIATYIYLASFGVLLNSKSIENENGDWKQEPLPTEPHVNLPVRRKMSLPSLSTKSLANPLGRSSSPLVSTQISEDTGVLPPSRPPSQPLVPTLPTPEMTPSLRSRSSVSSLEAAAEDAASTRLGILASLTPQPALPVCASNILRHWTEGMNPADYDWETSQNSILAGDQSPGHVADETTAKKRKRLKKRSKRSRENTLGSSSQPQPLRVGESQPSPILEPQQGSGVGARIGGGTMSQVSRGSTQGGYEFGKKARKKRREGF